MTAFHFFLSEDRTPVAPDTPQWAQPLPLERAAAGPSAPPQEGAAVTCGAYFTAMQKALGQEGCRPLREAVADLAGGDPAATSVDAVAIQLLKHGHFYHPSKVVVSSAGDRHRLVLNAALTTAGVDLLPRETAALAALAAQGGDLGLPRVLAQGGCPGSAPPGEADWRWFIGPWFEGCHEFHLTRQTDGPLAVAVWDAAPATRLLTAQETAELLAGAGRLLATAVNPHTLDHIFPWHHAAGDFVVSLDGAGGPRVRLITVRDYTPLLPPLMGDADPEQWLERLLHALLLLVVQAALRLRVDRLDGVGEVVLHPVAMVAPICRGLVDGLAAMRRRWDLPAALDAVMADYLRSPGLADLRALNQQLQGGFAAGSPERTLCADHLEAHTEALHQGLREAAATR